MMTCLWACEESNEEPAVIDEIFDSYVASFEREAAHRGQSIDVASLEVSIELDEVEQRNVLGLCFFNEQSPNRIVIDEDMWHELSDMYKEYVIFHELGHCVLDRVHDEKTLSDGTCGSIMASGTGRCDWNYRITNRDYYLDELFDH